MLKRPRLPEQRAAVEACQAAIARQFEDFGQSAPQAKPYLLFERGLHPSLASFADRELSGNSHEVLFEKTPESHLAKELSPWLVTLPGLPSAAQLQQLAIASQRRAAVAWLWSPLALPALANHLRAFMGATLWNDRTDEEEGEIALRITDPRVFPGFLAALTPAQQADLLRPLRAWAIWDRHLRWEVWDGPAAIPENPPEPLRISLSQLGAMNRHTQPDKILSLLDDEYSHSDNAIRDQLLRLPEDERYRAVWALVAEARRFGYCSDQDLMLFVSLAYALHSRFFELPTIGQALQQGGATGIALAATVNTLPDRAWQEVEVALAEEYAQDTPATPTTNFSRAS